MWHNKQEREGGKGPAAIRSKGSKAGLKDSTVARLQGAAAAAAVTPWPWDTKLLLPLPENQVKDKPWVGAGQSSPSWERQNKAETGVGLLFSPARRCYKGCAAGQSPCAGHRVKPGSAGQRRGQLGSVSLQSQAVAWQHYPGPSCHMDSPYKLELTSHGSTKIK